MAENDFELVKESIHLPDFLEHHGTTLKQSGDHFVTHCWLHNEKEPSMAIYGDHYHCFGCSAHGDIFEFLASQGSTPYEALEEAARYAGISLNGKSNQSLPGQSSTALTIPDPSSPGSSTPTLPSYAQSKLLEEDRLRALGLHEGTVGSFSGVIVPYRDKPDGPVTLRRIRTIRDGREAVVSEPGGKHRLYGCWLDQKGENIALVEGESDCHTLWQHGIPALGLPGAGSFNAERDDAILSRYRSIYVLREPDKGGETLMKRLTASSLVDRIKIVQLDGAKDVSALHVNLHGDHDAFMRAFRSAVARATPLTGGRQPYDYLAGLRSLVDGSAGTQWMLPTGIPDLDRMIGGGMEAQQLVAIGARPSMGKSSMGVDLARHAAIHARTPAIFLSLEQSAEEIAKRLATFQAQIDYERFRTGTLTDLERQRLQRAIDDMANSPLLVEPAHGQKFAQLAETCRWALDGKRGLIVLDYLGKVVADDVRMSEYQNVTRTIAACKNLAVELDSVMVVLGQLNRRVEYRESAEPELSDFRDSGAIDATADLAILLWREEEELYGPSFATVNVGLKKNRNGPEGLCRLGFDRAKMHFASMTKPSHTSRPPEQDYW